MTRYFAFLKKELLEASRTYKLLIIVLVFATIGFSNPIIAKLTPELLASSGFDINIPEPTLIDSYVQFYKNISTQLILFIILFAGTLSNELKSGSLINMVTKGLERSTILISKLSAMYLIWSLSYTITFLITYFYSPLLLAGSLDYIWIASLFPWLYGILMITISMLGAVISKQMIGSLILPLLFIIVMAVLGLIANLNDYLPAILSSDSLGLLTNATNLDYFLKPTVVTLLLIPLLTITSISIFNKQYL